MRIGDWTTEKIGEVVTVRGTFPGTVDEWTVTGYLSDVRHSGPLKPIVAQGSEPFRDPDDFKTVVTVLVGPTLTEVKLELASLSEHS